MLSLCQGKTSLHVTKIQSEGNVGILQEYNSNFARKNVEIYKEKVNFTRKCNIMRGYFNNLDFFPTKLFLNSSLIFDHFLLK